MRTNLPFVTMRSLLPAVALILLGVPAVRAQSAKSVESPKIRALQDSAKDPHAVEQFWEGIRTAGAPIVELMPEDPKYSLVTFVWRGDAGTRNVVVISPLALVNLQQAEMTQLPGTDVWYLTYRMRNDARMAYRFSANDSLVPFEAETNFFARMSNFKRDPLNTKTYDYGGGMTASLLELPGAPSDRWIQPHADIPHGTVKEAKLKSAILKNERSVRLYTPPSYDPSRTYPLLVVMDGDSYTTLVPTPTILDNLIHEGKIPPVVALFVGNASAEARDTELNCSKSWSDFLVKEAIPWIETTENVHVATKEALIAGSSMGGLAAACAAVDHPEVFGKVLAQSGSFYRAPSGEEPESLARHLANSPRLPLQFYIEVGLLETAAIPSRDPSMLTANRHLRDVLIAKGYEIEFRDRFSGHEHAAWRATFSDGLTWLLAAPSKSN